MRRTLLLSVAVLAFLVGLVAPAAAKPPTTQPGTIELIRVDRNVDYRLGTSGGSEGADVAVTYRCTPQQAGDIASAQIILRGTSIGVPYSRAHYGLICDGQRHTVNLFVARPVRAPLAVQPGDREMVTAEVLLGVDSPVRGPSQTSFTTSLRLRYIA